MEGSFRPPVPVEENVSLWTSCSTRSVPRELMIDVLHSRTGVRAANSSHSSPLIMCWQWVGVLDLDSGHF